MLKNELMLRNPMRILNRAIGAPLSPGGFGAVLARAGVGKTAFLVQLALESLIEGRNVLHISLNDPVQKVSLWYQEVLHTAAAEQAVREIAPLWESLQPHLFIMTFRVEGFSAPRLEERMTDLTAQDIFQPEVLLVDGLPFKDPTSAAMLEDLKALAKRFRLRVWFTVRTHRHEAPDEGGLPPQIQPVDRLFDILLQLSPEGDSIQVLPLRGLDALSLVLDPATMRVRDNG
ncbi:MAG: cytoplasmic protein [Desulfobacteraceae bacterium]|jgi:hypothetical protein|nr:cytoplasmic protein [Desulfobacteraceae bacterium]